MWQPSVSCPLELPTATRCWALLGHRLTIAGTTPRPWVIRMQTAWQSERWGPPCSLIHIHWSSGNQSSSSLHCVAHRCLQVRPTGLLQDSTRPTEVGPQLHHCKSGLDRYHSQAFSGIPRCKLSPCTTLPCLGRSPLAFLVVSSVHAPHFLLGPCFGQQPIGQCPKTRPSNVRRQSPSHKPLS